MKPISITTLAVVVAAGGLAGAQRVVPGQATQQRKVSGALVTSTLPQPTCNSMPAIKFAPLTIAWLTDEYNNEFGTHLATLTPQSMITYDGKTVTAQQMLDNLNAIEMTLNANGYSMNPERGTPGVYACNDTLNTTDLTNLNAAAANVSSAHIPDNKRTTGSIARKAGPGQSSAPFPPTGQPIPFGNINIPASMQTFLAAHRTGYIVPGHVIQPADPVIKKTLGGGIGGGLECGAPSPNISESRFWSSNVIGQKTILAVQASASSSVNASSAGTNLDGQFRVDYWKFGNPGHLCNVTASVGVDAANTGSALLIVQDPLGNTHTVVNSHASVSGSMPAPVGGIQTPITLANPSDTVSLQFNIGPVPCELDADWSVLVAYDYNYFAGGGTPHPNGIRPLVAFGQGDLYAIGDVNITHLGPDFIIVRFGFASDLQLIAEKLTLTALVKLDFDSHNQPYFGAYFDGYDTFRALQSRGGASMTAGAAITNGAPGSLSAYIEYPHFSWHHFFHPTWQRSTRTIWSWPGIYASGYIFSVNEEIPY